MKIEMNVKEMYHLRQWLLDVSGITNTLFVNIDSVSYYVYGKISYTLFHLVVKRLHSQLIVVVMYSHLSIIRHHGGQKNPGG